MENTFGYSKLNDKGGGDEVIHFKNSGDFAKTEKFLKKSMGRDYMSVLHKYGQIGVSALASMTPVDTGETAASWDYEIIQNQDGFSLAFNNNHVEKGINIAVILQYGHATRGGGYVQGIDYINPALRPVFENLANAAWKEVVES